MIKMSRDGRDGVCSGCERYFDVRKGFNPRENIYMSVGNAIVISYVPNINNKIYTVIMRQNLEKLVLVNTTY